MCPTHVSSENILWIQVSDTCVGHMCQPNVFTEHIFVTHVSDMCPTHVSSKCFHWIQVSDTCVGHMCPKNVFTGYTNVFSRHMCRTHVLDTSVRHMCPSV